MGFEEAKQKQSAGPFIYSPLFFFLPPVSPLSSNLNVLAKDPPPPSTPQGYALRDNGRIALHDEEVASNIFSRIEPLIPKMIDGKKPVGCSPNIRLYRYFLGQRFGKHVDDSVFDEGFQVSCPSGPLQCNVLPPRPTTALIGTCQISFPRLGLISRFFFISTKMGWRGGRLYFTKALPQQRY